MNFSGMQVFSSCDLLQTGFTNTKQGELQASLSLEVLGKTVKWHSIRKRSPEQKFLKHPLFQHMLVWLKLRQTVSFHSTRRAHPFLAVDTESPTFMGLFVEVPHVQIGNVPTQTCI